MSDGERTVLLTGASGLVGPPTLAALHARGFHIHAVARHAPANTDTGVTWHAANLLDPADRRRLIETTRATHLVHLAWYVEHGRFWTAPENDAWVAASLDLLDVFAQSGGRRAVFTGTCAEYDWSRGGDEPLRETDPCRPATVYGRAKLALLEQASALAARRGISCAWARFFLIFGLGEDERRLIPAIIRGLLDNTEIALSSGRQIRDFLDTRDVGAALAALADTEHVTGPINVGSGRPVSIRTIGEMLARMANRPETLLKFGALPDREGEPHALIAEVSRLANEVRFSPAETLETRLAQCLDWHRAKTQSA